MIADLERSTTFGVVGRIWLVVGRIVDSISCAWLGVRDFNALLAGNHRRGGNLISM